MSDVDLYIVLFLFQSDPDEDLVSTDLLKMYKKPGEKRNGNSSDKELIDISSDDDSLKNDEEVPVKRMRTDSVVTVGNKPSKKHSQNDNILEPEIQVYIKNVFTQI